MGPGDAPRALNRRTLLAGGALALAVARPASLIASVAVRNGRTHEGTPVDCDLPDVIQVKNAAGIDGLGLCVWASSEMMARYLYCPPLIGVFEQMRGERGGGWPERVDQVMRDRAPGVPYRQYLGRDIAFVREFIETGRPVCVTYGYGEFYNNRTIAHMVLCVGMNDRWTAVLDNNDIHKIWWMETPEFARRFAWPNGQGWAWCLLTSPPPPVPHN